VLLINLYYVSDIKEDSANISALTSYFILYLVAALLLIVRFNLLDQQSQWRSEGTFFRPDISFDFLRDGLIFSLLVIGFAWLMPPFVDAKTLDVFDEYHILWRDVQDEWNRMFADLNYRDRESYDSFGGSLRLGGARRLSDEPVMDVQVEGVGRYWRAVVYDYYTGDGWLTRDEDRAAFGPDDPITLPVFEMRQPVTQTYTFYRDNATVLYAMSNPVYVDRSTRASFNAFTQDQLTRAGVPGWSGGGSPWGEEITYLRSSATVDSGESYQVVSLASRATTNQLETAGDNYPAWVTERYLNLPPSITDRTRTLAQQISADYDNNFARAQAIERWLRNNIQYNESISAPPAGVDKVDYILFNRQEAYCDYYATSMIVMLRSLGIPARMAAGFARGTFDSEVQGFKVLNRDAHSWVEAYFPQYGWIEFEPTAAQPNIIRETSPEQDGSLAAGLPLPDQNLPEPDIPEDPGNIPIDDEAFGNVSPFGFSFSLPFVGTQLTVPPAAAGGGLAIVFVALLAAGFLFWRWQKQLDDPHSQADVISLYQRMVRLAGWMGLQLRPWQTPYEHAASMHRTLPEFGPEIDTLTESYVQTAYRRPQTDDPPPAKNLGAAWRRLRPAMLKYAVTSRLPRRLKK
jgi:transglutaminase-like putative cysteine protease